MPIVSFTSTPNRIARIRPMVESLKRQEKKPDQINIYLAEGTHAPAFLEELGVQVAYVPVPDWGPATKLIPFLLSRPEAGTRVITVDDDIIYDPYLVSDLVGASDKHPEAIVCRMGVQNGNFLHSEFLTDFQKVDVVGGYRGVLYRPEFFDTKELISDYDNTTVNSMICSDDHLFSYYLAKKNVPKYAIPFPTTRERPPLDRVIGEIQKTFLNLDSGIQGNPRGNSAHLIEDYYRAVSTRH